MIIHFDGSKYEKRGGSGVIFITLWGIPIPYSFKLEFPCTNNNAEYDALILAIKIALKLKLWKVKFIKNSLLIINQINEIFQCKEPLLQKYKQIAKNLLSSLTKYEIQATSRSNNRFTDAIMSIGSLILQNLYHRNIHIEIVQITKSALKINDHIYDILDIIIEKKKWYNQLVKFLRDGVLPKDLIKSAKKTFKLWASHYCMLGDILYRRGFDGILLCCLEWTYSQITISSAHDGICERYFSEPTIKKYLIRMGYYWPTMEHDYIDYIKKYIKYR